MAIPPNLEGTARLVERAFPEGVTKDDYWPLLAVLYPYMSERALARVVGHFVGQPYELVLNDIYGVNAKTLPSDRVDAVRARLVAAGLDEWDREEDW
ncbi:DUF3349 domain-containing protein [Corallococcus exercitus]|nr:DUF3349 domain-containing protein [Corallococcus exercitus]